MVDAVLGVCLLRSDDCWLLRHNNNVGIKRPIATYLGSYLPSLKIFFWSYRSDQLWPCSNLDHHTVSPISIFLLSTEKKLGEIDLQKSQVMVPTPRSATRVLSINFCCQC